jgi:hypothetical protein
MNVRLGKEGLAQADYCAGFIRSNFPAVMDLLGPVARKSAREPALVVYEKPLGQMLGCEIFGNVRHDTETYLDRAAAFFCVGSPCGYDPISRAIYVEAQAGELGVADGSYENLADAIGEELGHSAWGASAPGKEKGFPKAPPAEGTIGALAAWLSRFADTRTVPGEFYGRLAARLFSEGGKFYSEEKVLKVTDRLDSYDPAELRRRLGELRGIARKSLELYDEECELSGLTHGAMSLAEHLPGFSAEWLCDEMGGPKEVVRRMGALDCSPAKLVDEIVFPTRIPFEIELPGREAGEA